MADRLTQLQDAVNKQADNFTNSLGILQQCATPTPFNGLGAHPSGKSQSATPQPQQQQQIQQQHEDHTSLFAQLIARTAKDIEILIDSLPAEESSSELQASSLQKLEKDNQEAAQKLEDVVQQGEAILQEIQSALHDIAQSQLEIQKLEVTAANSNSYIAHAAAH
ncbi:hypothetical protein TCAL_08909 [Tigriopus californicus]|uniref:Mediator of RNA polymerase II transcription subunit 21 n=1 Tax=Tigriopus californicus TaxID=6832 RepID=A0A553NY71_TIGCA|nr:mediator of RNA polymerase II transcription subunit 21-like [Tigriopus californicus]TRY70385.1 hypothetical protein TCAL_08909 [Tigriopus californicus]|eukprot:TCALIF_08909-PA protein Name:"Similar to MED21 Mediator of RNA polymerase II transcription subunit 21 (Aedes aegypti)" AED:0.33 eAED:0.33 QI:0/0/0/0.33/1/1/3/0/164